MNLGARLMNGACRFRVWAPVASKVFVRLGAYGDFPLAAHDGYFEGLVPGVTAGTRYWFVVDGTALPDPCSRYQPDGPHGASMVIDPAFDWTDQTWPGVEMSGQVLYELHVGAFTPEGTLDAAAERLSYLKETGVTLIELMPLNTTASRWNWGYDGVFLFAPAPAYGDYAALQRFVDRAHRIGLGVILDVVYNHLGPEGNYLPRFSPDYFTSRYATDWGEPLNLEGPAAAPVRDFFYENACEWIGSFHLDGLRLDATQSIFDANDVFLAELVARARARVFPRKVVFIAENEPQAATRLEPPERRGWGLDAMWNDDFHHAARVAATGRRGAYYRDYTGRATELAASVKRGFLFQGQYYQWQGKRRGEAFTAPCWTCVNFLQNHDQVANSLTGERFHQLTSPGRYRALTAVLLLAPETPLLFMGQEFAASSPFHFFAQHEEPLRSQVWGGRKEFLKQFPEAADEAALSLVPDPAAPETYLRSKLDWQELEQNRRDWLLHRDLLGLRARDEVIHLQGRTGLETAALNDDIFVVRWFSPLNDDRLLIVNLGADRFPDVAAEPLLAPPPGGTWEMLWSSDDVTYGGSGKRMPETPAGWSFPAEAAVLLSNKGDE